MKATVLSLYGLAKSQKKGWKVREVGVGVGQVLGYGQAGPIILDVKRNFKLNF
jgi:hypothetical protein